MLGVSSAGPQWPWPKSVWCNSDASPWTSRRRRYRLSNDVQQFSKHQFQQPQLLAILCLIRYEDWTYREAAVRLVEHSELRRALRLASVPEYTTLYRFLRLLDETAIARALKEVLHRIPLLISTAARK